MENITTTVKTPAGIGVRNRALLTKLHREITGPFTVVDAARTWRMDPQKTRRRLAYFANNGWLARIRPGAYIAVPLEATVPGDWREDPLIVASRLFAPGYVGGWSACEHWGLTDQIFRDVVVMTTKKLRNHRPTIQGTTFRIVAIAQWKLFGTTNVWRRGIKISISDPTRTMVDVLVNPSLGGGISHVAGVLQAYWESEGRDEVKLIEYIDGLRAGSVAKRLGYLLEVLHIGTSRLIRECLKRRTKGLILLDPSMERGGPIVSRWGLRANVPSLVPEGRRPK